MEPRSHTILLDVVGLEHEHLESGLLPNISGLIGDSGESAKLEPTFPAVTCSVQASLLSGKFPETHGIVANGIYDRETYSVSFWEQASSLVGSERVWDASSNGSKKAAALFLQNTMYANLDIVVTPRPLHLESGMVMWCYSKPQGFYEQISSKIGEFDLSSYWGPLASSRSSEWITAAAEYTLGEARPDFMCVYIPHVDYSAQRFGRRAPQTIADVKKADELVGRLANSVAERGLKEKTNFVIVSEYGFNDVVGPAVPLNLILRDAGLVSIRTIQGKEYIDLEYSNAFAMVDHQVAHIYVKKGFAGQTKRILEDIEGVDMVLDQEGIRAMKLAHPRSGDLVAISARDKWFSYPWWHDEQRAPDFARRVDIHRKPGYDPVELFFDPRTRSIPLDTSPVKGSHGRPADSTTGEGFAFYASNRKHGIVQKSGIVHCTDIIRTIG